MSEIYEFKSAIVYARKIDKIRVVSGSASHRQQYTKLEHGYIIIEEKWFPANPKKDRVI